MGELFLSDNINKTLGLTIMMLDANDTSINCTKSNFSEQLFQTLKTEKKNPKEPIPAPTLIFRKKNQEMKHIPTLTLYHPKDVSGDHLQDNELWR